jgi:cytochrome c oxidase cbb3-type subunit III
VACRAVLTNLKVQLALSVNMAAGLRIISCLMALAATAVGAQDKTKGPPSAAQVAAQGAARSTYESVCAGCHGLDARGSERGPNLATRPEVLLKSDAELLEILKNGRTAKGMPSFSSYSQSSLAALVAYLRLLQGRGESQPLPGDPARGMTLFFGKAKCADCHMVGGQGGFWGQDLSSYAGRMNADELREQIVYPNKNFDARRGLVTVTLANSTTLSGVVRNEDNFSLQLQTADGAFHLLNKSEIKSQIYEGHSAMPSDYGSTLSTAELNDLVSYLLSASGSGNTPKAKRATEDGDDE